MPNRVDWEADFSVGHDALDAQHREILAQCNRLADLCAAADDTPFREAYAALMRMASAHFAAEEALLVAGAYPELDDYRCELEEYAFLAAEIATTEHFDPIELQRFLALWWVGHVMDAARQQREFLAGAVARHRSG